MNRRKAIGGIRRAQLITTYGVGSMVGIEDGSFMITGIDQWPAYRHHEEDFIQESRLQRQLGVSGFRLPPASESENLGDIPVVRFPKMLSCPGCRRLATASEFGVRNNPATCKRCKRNLVPSRFVVCCPNGHIDDFPYFAWVHAGSPPTGDVHEMRIDTAGRSAALGDIVVSCTCGKKSPMEGALRKNALKKLTTCSGRHPWLGAGSAREECTEVPRGTQRGASAVWFSAVRSAISIPPWSERLQKLISRHWKTLREPEGENLRTVIELTKLADHARCSVDDLVRAVEERHRIERGIAGGTDDDLKADEYEALIRTTDETSGRHEFVCVPADEEIDASLSVAQVMKVKRLREVRVLEGFTRLGTAGAQGIRTVQLRSPGGDPDWLPAMEVLGEGIFLRLDSDRIAAWESNAAVRARVRQIDNARLPNGATGASPGQITPRLMMIHTLAHTIINEWALDCGYPAASMRERLYVSDNMAGFMIYTATSDSDGSLGGIVARAESGDLGPSIRRAIERSKWCSADPLCIESPPSGAGNLNHAACHACVLLPETSCEHFNTLLDRALLVGTPSSHQLGFFGVIGAPS